LRIRRRVIRWLAALVLSAAPVFAEIARPETLNDTLNALAEAYRATGQFEEVIVDQADTSVSLVRDGEEVFRSYPDNLHANLQNLGSNAERQAALDRFVRVILDGLDRTGFTTADVANVLPVVRPTGFQTGIAGVQPISDPLVGELSIYYIVDRPDTMSYITQDTLETLGLERRALRGLAMQNFHDKGWQPELRGQGVWMLVFDGNFETSFLLDHPIWDGFDTQLGTVVMMALARDVVLFGDGDVQGTEDELRRIATENFDKMSYPLSQQIYVWSENGWILR